MNPTTPRQPSSGRPDYSQPVAYDNQGRPLYAHPPAPPHGVQPPQPQMVYMARPVTPQDVHIPEEIKQRHEASKRTYPSLNLSEGEYIISAVKRHPIGLVNIWLVALLCIAVFGGLYYLLFKQPEVTTTFSDAEGLATAVGAGLFVLFTLIVLGALIASYIYNSNRFYLTNESVIQEIQTSLFSKHEQTVSLTNIEDASYRQDGIIPHLFNYGTIRLSTEGDETTYRFTYVAGPKEHIAVLNNAVEAFKNGRPVDPHMPLA